MTKPLRLSATGGAIPAYIEDVFSTYLYTGNGASLTINNGIDLSTKGGLVWLKGRSVGSNNTVFDTARGVYRPMYTNSTAASSNNSPYGIDAFNTNGFGWTSDPTSDYNQSGATYVSWTFRKQPKFFDVVTYTGNGAASRSISHSLGSKPGFVLIKRTDSTSDWWVAAWTGTTFYIGTDAVPFALNSTNSYNVQNGAAATSTTFDPNEVTLSSNYGVLPSAANTNGGTYVAYLFAHNAGGFGLTGNDNVISCGSFTTDGSGNATVNLGYEPQLVIRKCSSLGGDHWNMMDNMRGYSMQGYACLQADRNLAESAFGTVTDSTPTATGFQVNALNASATYIYIAIRRGPMKVPTTGTSVFTPATRSGTGATALITSAGFPVDLAIFNTRNTTVSHPFFDRLRGVKMYVYSDSTSAEAGSTPSLDRFDLMDGVGVGADGGIAAVNVSGNTYVNYFMRRAAGFFDEVCYTGTGVARTVTHNLGVAPEFIIVKDRSNIQNWQTQVAPLGATYGLPLSTSNAAFASTAYWNDTAPTSSVFTVGTSILVNSSGDNYVAYLFASCPGVSKVGSYTGNGSSQTINCGFAAGARFVLIKRTDSTGDWYVWDTARGIVSGNDPHLSLNTNAAEVTTDDTIDPDSTGFIVNQLAATNVNVTSATYIYLAIA